MRKRTLILTFSVVTLLLAAWAIAGTPVKQTVPGNSDTSGVDQPRAVVPQLEYVFTPVFEGVQIKHDFVIENRGTAPLVIKNVRPD